jgi:hypothetical protein
MKKPMLALMALGVITVSTPVTAQDYVVAPIGPGTISGNIDWVGGLILQDQLYGNRPQSNSSTRTPAPRPSMPTTGQNSPAGNSVLSYVPSLERRQANYREMAQRWRSNRSSIGREAEVMLQSGDALGRLEPTFNETFGLQLNNIADAYGYSLGVAWLVANQSSASLTRAQFQGLRDQIGEALISNGGMTSANDTIKQNISETALLTGLLTARAATQAKDDPAKRANLAADVRAATQRSMQIDLTTVQLTNKGFEPR